jgi:hypothetical protein
LPGALVRDLQRTAEGYDTHYEMLSTSANRILGEFKDPGAFAAHFDSLSQPVQEKVLRYLWKHPGARLHDLADKVADQFTLAEMAEANAWIEKWNARCR